MSEPIGLRDSWRSLVQDVYAIERGPSPEPMTLPYLYACILAPIFRHPIRAVLVWLGVPFLLWLIGFDARL